MSNRKGFFGKLVVLAILCIVVMTVSGCSAASDWARRDMPTAGLTHAVTYNLTGPAGTEKEVNRALLRGVNDVSPLRMLETTFGRMSGTKTQDVKVVLPDGATYNSLGMAKTKRFAGITNFATLEPATYWVQDALGNVYCGAKIRLDFNRNLTQYRDVNRRDFQSLWYYDIPCSMNYEAGSEPRPTLYIEQATLRALVLNEVWQARVATGSFFFNWGHSVTVIGGWPSWVTPGWWKHWDIPNQGGDANDALNIVNQMVLDLESSSQPWLEFKGDGAFRNSGSWVMYSAGDADQYANWDRVLLGRQQSYAVFYRPAMESPWDYVLVEPLYNYEWNDVHSHLWALRSWRGSPDNNKLFDEYGQPKTDLTSMAVVKELERIGWMNAPNASLDQIRWSRPDGEPLYVMTVRAHMGASDTLVIFGDAIPNFGLRNQVESQDGALPMPIVYDENGKEAATQPWNAERWADWQRESTFWNYLRDNPRAVSADLLVQYRFEDNTEWAPEYCTNSDGDRYVCDYRPVIWDLSTSYYMEGDPETPWYVLQTLGEVGVRTLGVSYCSGQFQGTGMEFALDQRVFHERFYAGINQEDVWVFDARAMQLPETLAIAWDILHAE